MRISDWSSDVCSSDLKAFRVVFFMDDAASRRHPLDVARADGAATAARVPVADFAVIDDGHGFKSAMRMLTNATRGGRVGYEQVRTGVIEQQERADRLGKIGRAHV